MRKYNRLLSRVVGGLQPRSGPARRGPGSVKFIFTSPRFISTCIATRILSSAFLSSAHSSSHIDNICPHMCGANDKGCIGSGVAGTMGALNIIHARGTAVAIGICAGSSAGCAGFAGFTRGLCCLFCFGGEWILPSPEFLKPRSITASITAASSAVSKRPGRECCRRFFDPPRPSPGT